MTEMWAEEQKKIFGSMTGYTDGSRVVEVKSMKEMGLGGLI